MQKRMQKRFRQVALLAALVPAFAMAQSIQNQSAAPAAAAPIDATKQAAIKDLLDAIQASKLVTVIANTGQAQTKQVVPLILSKALQDNKKLTEKQKQAAVPGLQKNVMPRLTAQAGQVFASDAFRQDAMQAQYAAYAQFYSLQEIKDLAAFYRSPTGRKFIEVQDKVGNQVVGSLMQKYAPQAERAVYDQAVRDVAAIRPGK